MHNTPMSRLQPADLQDPRRFRLLDRLEHQNLMPFLQQYYFNLRSPLIRLHFLILAAYLLAAYFAARGTAAAGQDWVLLSCFAVLLFIPLIPIHEAIHGLVYRLLGARDVRFSVSLRQFYAYAIADSFVVGRREFAWLALAPSLLINGVLLAVALAAPGARFFALALSIVHYSATGGDWALIAYFWEHRARPVYTYDDAPARLSYFYEEI